MKKKVWNISSLKKAFFNWVHLHRLSQDPGATCMHQQWHTRYSYDKVSNICRPFNYSGCEGNSNNFDSLYACQHTCKVALPHNSPARRQPNDLIEKCQMPRDHGKCHLGNLHPLAFTRNEGETRTQVVWKSQKKSHSPFYVETKVQWKCQNCSAFELLADITQTRNHLMCCISFG